MTDQGHVLVTLMDLMDRVRRAFKSREGFGLSEREADFAELFYEGMEAL